MNMHYGIYGGQYVPETLTGALRELAQTYLEAKDDPAFPNRRSTTPNGFRSILADHAST